MAFIRFCGYNTPYKLSTELHAICRTNTSSFTQSDSLREKIRVLQDEGHIYTNDSLQRLLAIVDTYNIIPIDLHPPITTARRSLELVLDRGVTGIDPGTMASDDDLCDPDIRDLLRNLLDTFDINTGQDNKHVALLLDKLEIASSRLKTKIQSFLIREGHGRKVAEWLDELKDWSGTGDPIYITQEDATAVRMATFFATAADNLGQVYPNIIMNGISFAKARFPTNWKFSQVHYRDLQTILQKEVSTFYKFYADATLIPVLETLQEVSKSTLDLMRVTPFFANIYLEGKLHPTILNGVVLKDLIYYYWLCILSMYIDATEPEERLLVQEAPGDSLEEAQVQVALAASKAAAASAGKSGSSVSEQISLGAKAALQKKVAELIRTYLQKLVRDKAMIDSTNLTIEERVLKAREKEKAKITKRLGDLTVEEREVENLLKNHRLERWSLGQTRALYQYDPEQYEKERQTIERDMQIEMEAGTISTDPQDFMVHYLSEMNAEEVELFRSWSYSRSRTLPAHDSTAAAANIIVLL